MNKQVNLDKAQIADSATRVDSSDTDNLSIAGSSEEKSIDPQTSKSIGRFGGLSAKLLVLTIGFVMVSEVFVFLPSVAKFRVDWLTDRLTRAQTVLLVYEGEGHTRQIPKTPLEISRMEAALLNFDVVTFAVRRNNTRHLIAMLNHGDLEVGNTFDVNETGLFKILKDAIVTLFNTEPRLLLVRGSPPGTTKYFEVVIREEPLRVAMLRYTRNVMILSLIISLSTAAMVYLALSVLFVRPIRDMASNMVAFSNKPEAASNIIKPSKRQDELGVAEAVLARMQQQLQDTLSSQKRLATLGLAVSKINHDLRNILASVQLVSDRLTDLPDPNVQRFAPKLIAGIDRAIGYCQATLAYGSATEEPPKRELVTLHNIVKQMAILLGLEDHKTISWQNEVPEHLELHVDPEQIFRVLMNLCKNAAKELEDPHKENPTKRLTVKAYKQDKQTIIEVIDTGLGIPKQAQTQLFEAFKGSFSKGGTGLGLAIAHEIVTAHQGSIKLLETGSNGTTFQIALPDC